VTTNDVTKRAHLECLIQDYNDLMANYKCYVEMLDDRSDDWEIFLRVDVDDEGEGFHILDNKHRKYVIFPEYYEGEVVSLPRRTCCSDVTLDEWEICGDSFWNPFGTYSRHRTLPQGAEEDMLSALIYYSAGALKF
jgi:hypothetical protein